MFAIFIASLADTPNWFVTVVIALPAASALIEPAFASVIAASVTLASASVSFSNSGACEPIRPIESAISPAPMPNFLLIWRVVSDNPFIVSSVTPVSAWRASRCTSKSPAALPAAIITPAVAVIARVAGFAAAVIAPNALPTPNLSAISCPIPLMSKPPPFVSGSGRLFVSAAIFRRVSSYFFASSANFFQAFCPSSDASRPATAISSIAFLMSRILRLRGADDVVILSNFFWISSSLEDATPVSCSCFFTFCKTGVSLSSPERRAMRSAFIVNNY